MAKKKRVPSEIEIEYIKNHTNLTAEELAEKMPDVDAKELEILLQALKSQHTTEAQNINSENDFIAGNLMAKREGVTVMTQAASELADARKTVRVVSDPNFETNNRDKIHVINPGKKADGSRGFRIKT